jgi:hypothetical protein
MENDSEWIQRLIQAAKQIIPKDFFGNVQINAQGGGISNVNVTQLYKGDGK